MLIVHVETVTDGIPGHIFINYNYKQVTLINKQKKKDNGSSRASARTKEEEEKGQINAE